jgi:hypothetical protein
LIDTLSLGYQYSNAFQDNRQITREQADFKAINHQLTLDWQALDEVILQEMAGQ